MTIACVTTTEFAFWCADFGWRTFFIFLFQIIFRGRRRFFGSGRGRRSILRVNRPLPIASRYMPKSEEKLVK